MSKSNPIPLTIADIIAPMPELKLNDSILILKAEDSRKFAISIDNLTGMNISRILAGGKIEMPILDLLVLTLAVMEIPIKNMTLKQDANHDFHFLPYIAKGDRKIVMKMKLSDGLYLAVRTDAPIFIHEEAAEATIIDEHSMESGMADILKAHEARCKITQQMLDIV